MNFATSLIHSVNLKECAEKISIFTSFLAVVGKKQLRPKLPKTFPIPTFLDFLTSPSLFAEAIYRHTESNSSSKKESSDKSILSYLLHNQHHSSWTSLQNLYIPEFSFEPQSYNLSHYSKIKIRCSNDQHHFLLTAIWGFISEFGYISMASTFGSTEPLSSTDHKNKNCRKFWCKKVKVLSLLNSIVQKLLFLPSLFPLLLRCPRVPPYWGQGLLN